MPRRKCPPGRDKKFYNVRLMLASLHPSHTRRVPKMTFWTRRRVVATACCPCSARSAGRETPSRSACAIASFRAGWRKFIRDSSTRAVRISPSLIEPTLRDLEIGVIVDLTGPRGNEAQQVERAAAE